MARTSYIFMRCWWCCQLCTRPIRRVGFYSASSLKQRSAGRHVATLIHIILIPSKPVFCSYYCVLTRDATNTNCMVFGLDRCSNPRSVGLEASTITITRNTNAVQKKKNKQWTTKNIHIKLTIVVQNEPLWKPEVN
jgi:hypothetical protein